MVSGDAATFAADEPAPGLRQLVRRRRAEALIHGLLKRRLPGPGTRILAHELRYDHTVQVGESLDATIRGLTSCRPTDWCSRCEVLREGDRVLSGRVTVAAPLQHMTVSQVETPAVMLRRNDVFGKLLRACRSRRTGAVCGGASV